MNELPEATIYWEERAQRFASVADGLPAICSYGMPRHYNAAIDRGQRRALAPWLAVPPGTRVLDVGCGVGRWSRYLAGRGAEVTGVDLSPTMVAEATRRAAAQGLAERCRFLPGDLARLDLGERFDLVLGVTVLQHILDPEAFAVAVEALAAHLAPHGRVVLLEAAPSRPTERLDSPVFTARTDDAYRRTFTGAGLAVTAVGGVDPAPFRRLFLPWYRRLPGPLARLGLALVTALSLPADAALAGLCVRASWHKVFILRHRWGGSDARAAA